MTILYGQPADPGAFRTHYYDTHIPLARKMSGLTGWNLCWVDAEPGEPAPPYFLIAELFSADKAAMDAILASPEGMAASADLNNFATGGVTFLPAEVEEVALA